MPFSREKKEKQKDRFTIKKERENVLIASPGCYVLKDEVTGVNYLVINRGGFAVTPLLGTDGKPIIDPVE